MNQGFVRATLMTLLVLFAGCSDPAPETTMDGIFTAEQAQRGEGLFNQHCTRCHSIQEFTGRSFETLWVGTPTAALYLRIANTMPLDQPGSLGTVQSTALLAHILQENGMPPGDVPLEADLEFLTSILVAPAS